MQARGQRGRRAGLSALYALSMAVMYALLGTVAALAGKAFGFQFQNPVVVGVLMALLVLFALALFGVYKFQVPPVLMQYVGARQGWLGAIMMGCLAGIAAAPCIGPVIAALVPIVAALANPTLGFLLFFALGLGLGTPYFVLGLFYERFQNRLPRAGEWTILVERLFGVLLLAVALYFARSLLSPWCQACTELEEYTYTDPRVVREAERFVRLVVDATRSEDENVQRILKQHGVVGLPTVIFIGADGQERRDLRLTGFEPADSFLKRMQQVR
jgi:thiol:disulfide interchange protein DsbD